MKKYIVLLIIAYSFGSCKKGFLDPNPTDRLAETSVWTSPSLIEAALNYNYNDLSFGIYTRGGIADDNQMLANITDEVASDYEGYEGRNVFVNGELSTDNIRSSRFTRLGWNESYNYIARANEFIERLQTVTVLSAEKTAAYEGEIKTLRAWRYFNLLKQFGGVPLISTPFKLGDDYLNVSRATIAETLAFILADLDAGIAKLPDQPSVKGRIDKLIAKSFRSRVLLYAASPLYTGGTSDNAKWQAAAVAAKEVIDAGRYSLEPDFEKYRKSFITYDPASSEIIFAREHDAIYGTGPTGNGLLPPYSHGPLGAGGLSYYAPLQQLVDDYETSNGLSITDPLSGYNPQNPYINRDPRFNAFIYHHGSVLNGRTLDYRVDGTDRPAGGVYVNPTGYNTRKFVNEARFNANGTGITPGANDPVPWIHIRYAEILLNYAEAINEAEGPANAYQSINLIRQRAGLPNLTPDLSQSQLRDKIRHERKIELVFEEHRFWDVRRWKILESTQSITLGGIAITGATPTAVTYAPVTAEGYDLIQTRVFLQKHYFWPIQRAELNANPNLTQTPGY